MVHIGDEVLAKLPLYSHREDGEVPLSRGKVFWVHPQGRFFRAKFRLPEGSPVTETFSIVNGKPFGAEILERRKRRGNYAHSH